MTAPVALHRGSCTKATMATSIPNAATPIVYPKSPRYPDPFVVDRATRAALPCWPALLVATSQLPLEHFSKNYENAFEYGSLKNPQTPEQALAINRPNLIEHDQPGLALESARHPEWVRHAGRGQWCDDDGLKVGIQFVW